MNQLTQQYHVEDVGKILLQAQNEIKNLRNQVKPGQGIDSADIDDILQRAENDLRQKAEIVLNGVVNNSMLTLPAIASSPSQKPLDKSHDEKLHKKILSINMKKEQAKRQHNIFNSHSLNSDYTDLGEIHLPFKSKPESNSRPSGSRPIGKSYKGRIFKKKTSKPDRMLPKVNRIDPSASAPTLGEEDANMGMLSLLNRGFLPKSLDLTPAMEHGRTLLNNKVAKIHSREEILIQTAPFNNPTCFNLAALKLDVEAPPDNQKRSLVVKPQSTPTASKVDIAFEPQSTVCSLEELNNTDGDDPEVGFNAVGNFSSIQDNQDLRKNVEKIRDYNELLDTYSLHQFIIRKGKTISDTPEFISFKRKSENVWGSIRSVIQQLETLLSAYFIPLAYIDGQRIAQLASNDVAKCSRDELISCILNNDHVSSLIKRPGRRYLGSSRFEIAAIRIQSLTRMYLVKLKIHQMKYGINAISYIQAVWRICLGHKGLQKQLRSVRQKQREQWEHMMSNFCSNWNQIKKRQRVVIHVPSFSAEEHVRLRMNNFASRQNLQMARLCAIADPLVEVIYISPFEISADVKEYYMKLMELGGIVNPSSRIKILCPENSDRFPDHFSLSTLLLYSPQCCRRIRRYIRGKEAYLVPGMVTDAERKLAINLHVPLLGVEPKAGMLYSTKSGGKRLFAAAEVNIPIGAYDIYDEQELIFSLAKLIYSNLWSDYWLVKIDHDCIGNGIAKVNVSSMKSVQHLRKKFSSTSKTRDGNNFDNMQDIQLELEKSLSAFVKPCFPKIFPKWNNYLQEICRAGCIIEALPSNIKGYVRVNLFIEPTGRMHITSSHNHLLNSNNSFHRIGVSFPQTLVPHQAIQGASTAIARELFKVGIIGYSSIDYVTFFDKDNMQRLWALEIFPYLTDSSMSFVLFNFLMGGQYNTTNGKYAIECEILKKDEKSHTMYDPNSNPEKKISSTCYYERAYVVLDYIYHPNLATMRYATFFNTCRLNGVCFDLRNNVGTAFILADSLVCGILGILSSGETEKDALKYISTAVELIHEEVGSHALISKLDGSKISGNFVDIISTIRTFYPNDKK